MSDYTPSMEDLLDVWADNSDAYPVAPDEYATWDDRYELGRQALAAHDAEVRAEVVAKFETWTNAAISDKREAEIRADEREKAVERVRAEVMFWMHKCAGTEVCLICLHANSAIAAARREQQ